MEKPSSNPKIILILGAVVVVGASLWLWKGKGGGAALPLTKEAKEEAVKKEVEKTVSEVVGAAQNKKGVFDVSQVKNYKKVGEEFAVEYQRRIYEKGKQLEAEDLMNNTSTLKGKASYKITSQETVDKIGIWEPKAGEKYLVVYLEVKGDSGNEGMPQSFDQTGSDPSPQFFLVDSGNKKYSLQTAEANSAARNAQGESLMTTDMTVTSWTKSALAFQIPASGVNKPTLVLSVPVGNKQYEYIGVRLD